MPEFFLNLFRARNRVSNLFPQQLAVAMPHSLHGGLNGGSRTTHRWKLASVFAIDWNKPFLGHEALMKQKQAGVKRRLVIFVLEDPEPMLWGSEPIYRDGQPVGYTTSGFYGHSVGGAIAMGYVSNASGVSAKFIESGSYEINVSGRRYPAKAHLRAPYDPERKKLLS